MHSQISTPIVLFVFNRPQATRSVFQAIAAVRPLKLLVVADGPRSSKPGEDRLCSEVRSVAQNVSWPCQVVTNFSESNLGCRDRLISGLDWAFSLVEEAIILEDDCLPNETFFRFCEELLARYRNDSRIAMISGNNFVAPGRTTNYSYYFSQLAHIWGWATWRSAWKLYDRSLINWEAIKQGHLLSEIFSRRAEINHWTHIFQSMHDKTGPDTWDYQWCYTVLINNLLCIAPAVNLVQNVGFGPDATHTREGKAPEAVTTTGEIEFPLRHPPYMIPSRSFDASESESLGGSRQALGKRQRIRSFVHSVLGRWAENLS